MFILQKKKSWREALDLVLGRHTQTNGCSVCISMERRPLQGAQRDTGRYTIGLGVVCVSAQSKFKAARFPNRKVDFSILCVSMIPFRLQFYFTISFLFI
jgi:hypothetical protein